MSAYNQLCKDKLTANGYGAVEHNDREYWLGVAEFDGEYTEFKVMGAKRYCGRAVKDGELHITVAGVPKSGYKCLNNDISNFTKGMVFDGTTTGKLTHTYSYITDIKSIIITIFFREFFESKSNTSSPAKPHIGEYILKFLFK